MDELTNDNVIKVCLSLLSGNVIFGMFGYFLLFEFTQTSLESTNRVSDSFYQTVQTKGFHVGLLHVS